MIQDGVPDEATELRDSIGDQPAGRRNIGAGHAPGAARQQRPGADPVREALKHAATRALRPSVARPPRGSVKTNEPPPARVG
ncbi:hypothetical protein GCM10010210_36090 [Pseudonocardia hydrocarbonoxydans]